MFANAPLHDNSLMPWGAHKGKKTANVPAKYLLHLYNNNMCSDLYVKTYIAENLDVLQAEADNRITYNNKR